MEKFKWEKNKTKVYWLNNLVQVGHKFLHF